MSEPSIASNRVIALEALTEQFIGFFRRSRWATRAGEPGISDLVLGNPQELPLPQLVSALRGAIEPHRPDWFAYTDNSPAARVVVAGSLRRQRGLSFEDEDVFLTTGAFSGLLVSIYALTDPGDEVLFISPPWFFYESITAVVGAKPIRVPCDPVTFKLDLRVIEEAITPRTRAIIVNSPNNPTGVIYPRANLSGLKDVLEAATNRYGRPIFILFDEAYNHIVYDEQRFVSPAELYPYTIIIYTYGKTLLMPGQRIGYLALPLTLSNRRDLGKAIVQAQMTLGWGFPNALLQHALPDLEQLSIDVSALQQRRDRVVSALRKAGYETTNPAGTFYVMIRSPLQDDTAFIDRLAERDVYCLPGSLFEMPEWFRISLTATDAMVEQALPILADEFARVASESHASPTS